MRTIATLLVLLMISSVLAGCAGNDDSEKDEKIASLESEITNLTAENEEYAENAALLGSTLAMAQADLIVANEELSNLSARLGEAEWHRDNLTNALADAQYQLNQTQDDELITQLEAEIADLDSQISEADETISGLQSDLTEKSNEVANLEATNAALQSSMASLTYHVRERIGTCPETNPGMEVLVGYDDGSGNGAPDDGELHDEEIQYRFGECPGDHAMVESFQNNSNGFTPMLLVEMGGILYFSADDGIHGWELWRSDGTVAGTYLVKDIRDEECQDDGNGGQTCNNYGSLIVHCWNNDPSSCHYPEIVAGNEKLFFTGFDGIPGTETSVALFVSDGTSAGTQLVKRSWTNWNPAFVSEEGWGETPGPRYLIPIPSSGFIPDRVVYAAQDVHGEINSPPTGDELWISDGTESGTIMIANIQPEDESAYNPDQAATYCCGDFQGGEPAHLLKKGNTIWFSANSLEYGRELYRYGLQALGGGLFLTEDTRPGEEGSDPMWMTSGSDGVYYSADDGTLGRELYHSRGDAFTTGIVKDINSGNNSSDPMYFTKFGTKVFFTADDGVNGRELWISDRTEAGTFMVKDINVNGSSDPYQLNMLDGILYFMAYEEEHGAELWRSDGTAAGTYMVKDINPGANSSWHFYETYASGTIFTVHQGELFFGCNDGVHGVELCRSDGTAEGTRLAVDANPGENSSYPLWYTSVGQKLYFVGITPEHGNQLQFIWDNPGPFISTTEDS